MKKRQTSESTTFSSYSILCHKIHFGKLIILNPFFLSPHLSVFIQIWSIHWILLIKICDLYHHPLYTFMNFQKELRDDLVILVQRFSPVTIYEERSWQINSIIKDYGFLNFMNKTNTSYRSLYLKQPWQYSKPYICEATEVLEPLCFLCLYTPALVSLRSWQEASCIAQWNTEEGV